MVFKVLFGHFWAKKTQKTYFLHPSFSMYAVVNAGNQHFRHFYGSERVWEGNETTIKTKIISD